MLRHAFIQKRHRDHRKIGTLAGCFLLFTVFCPTLNGQTYKKNDYGLKIIDSISLYNQQIAKDSTLKLVPLVSYIPGLKTDLVYGTKENFTHQVLYQNPSAYLRLPAAKALQRAAVKLQEEGYGLWVFDAYRPYEATVSMWAAVPDNRYAADPRHGSGHNKGICVDLTLYNLHTGRPVPMPTGFDNFTAKAHQGYEDLPVKARQNREMLKKAMEDAGFDPLSTEWWHFSYPDAHGKFSLLDLSFADLAGISGPEKPLP